MYTNASLTNVWNGGLNFYGVTNVNGHYPDLDGGYALLITALGVVDSIVSCAPTPAPVTPSPTAAPQTNLELRLCGTTTPTYDVRVNGDYTDPSNVGRALTLGSGGGTGTCPTFNGTQCWEIVNVNIASYECTATVTATSSSCGGCAPTPIYDYATYTECYTSTTQVFRKLTTTSSWPSVVEYSGSGNNLCFSFTSTTTATSTVSIEPLTSHISCFNCESPTTFVSGFAGSGEVSDTAACAASTPAYIFTSRANVSLIQVGDTMYANSSLSTPFNGGLQWYGVSNVQGQSYSDYALLIQATGVVQSISNCTAPTPAPVPAPLPTPAPVATQEISVVLCGTTSPTYYVEAIGASGLTVGLGIKFSSGGTTGGCPTFDDTQCYEITGVNIGYHNCQGIVSQVSSNCGGLSGCTAPTPAPTFTPAPTATPAPSPTPAPVVSVYYYQLTNCPANSGTFTEIASTTILNPGSAVKMSDGLCYQVEDATAGINSNTAVATYADCTTCNATTPAPTPAPTAAPTPAPTPAPTCNAISLEFRGDTSFTCASYVTFYINTSDFCTATQLDRQSDCNRRALAGYYNDGSFYRYWDGSAFTTSCAATSCP